MAMLCPLTRKKQLFYTNGHFLLGKILLDPKKELFLALISDVEVFLYKILSFSELVSPT